MFILWSFIEMLILIWALLCICSTSMQIVVSKCWWNLINIYLLTAISLQNSGFRNWKEIEFNFELYKLEVMMIISFYISICLFFSVPKKMLNLHCEVSSSSNSESSFLPDGSLGRTELTYPRDRKHNTQGPRCL